MTWAFERENLSPEQKIVLLALADYADGNGICYPGQKNLARKTSVPERTLRRRIQELEALGLIERRRRKDTDGYRTSDEYRLIWNLPANMAGDPTGQKEGAYRPPVAGTKEPSEPSGNRKRATPIPTGWEPSNAHNLLAQNLKVDVDLEAAKFKDWALGKDAHYVDWEATFRKWLRTAAERPRAAIGHHPAQRPSRDAEIRDLLSGSLGLDNQPKELSQ